MSQAARKLATFDDLRPLPESGRRFDPDEEMLTVSRWTQEGYLEVSLGERGDTVRAEPFEAIEIRIGALFGDDDEESESG